MNAEGNCCEQSFAKIKRFFGGQFTGRRNQTNYERIVYIYEKFMRRKDFLVCGFGGCKALWKELPLLHRIAFLGRSICALGRRSLFSEKKYVGAEGTFSLYNNIVPPRPRSRYNSFFSCFTAAQHTLGNQQNNIILFVPAFFFLKPKFFLLAFYS